LTLSKMAAVRQPGCFSARFKVSLSDAASVFERSDQRPTCSTAATSSWARTGLGGLGCASLAERLLDACGHEVVRGMSDLVEGFGDILYSPVSGDSVTPSLVIDVHSDAPRRLRSLHQDQYRGPLRA
jgi:hypothetical protein